MPSILLSDNGVSSGSAGLKTTAASDGALALQTTTAGGTATTAVTIDTSQNVGVGITSIPNYSSNLRTVSFNNTSGVVHDYCVNGTRTGSFVCQSSGFDLTTQTAIPLVLSTNGTERARFNAGAPILCLSGGNTSATGTGIAFPATQSASSDANTLDDYEEGTWTPTQGAGLTVTGSFTSSGTYTKVGKIVRINFLISASTLACTSGNQMIGNLPFNNNVDSIGNFGCGISTPGGANYMYQAYNNTVYAYTTFTGVANVYGSIVYTASA